MNLRFWEKRTSIVDEPIARVLTEMNAGPKDAEFDKNLTYLERLQELKAGERRHFNVSPDTIALVLGNLAGIVIIVVYENKHVMTSKAMSFIKPKA